MTLLPPTAFTAALMTAAVMSLTSPALAQDWGWRGGGWGWPGASVGALATRAVVGNAAARNYSYGYGYPLTAMAQATATQLRLVWLGGAGPDWLRRERPLVAMVMGPATTTRLTPMVMAAVTAIQLPDFITRYSTPHHLSPAYPTIIVVV